MAIIKSVRGKSPKIGKNVFLADNAVIIGDVTIGDDCSIWFGAVLRGDVNSITIGDRSNIQDGVVIHTLYDGSPHPSPTHIGSDVSVGHNAIIHGGVVGDHCLIGMGSTILDNAHIGSGSIVGANALVVANSSLEPNGMYMGMPAKRVKDVTPEQRTSIIERTARDYMLYASWYDEKNEADNE